MLDPFKPERPEDVDHLLSLQADVHQAFKDLVQVAPRRQADSGRRRRLFSGAFWSGRQALARGLIDGIGHLHQVLKARFGDKLVIRTIHAAPGLGPETPRFWRASCLILQESAIDALETRALWSRFGL